MVILGIILTFIFGWLILENLRVEEDLFSKLSLSYLIGIGIQTLFMFYMALFNIKLTLVTVSLMMLTVCLGLFIILTFREKVNIGWKFGINPKNYKKVYKSLTLVDKIIILILLGLGMYSLIAGLYWPVSGWDAIALYDFRAKVFSVTGYMNDAISRGYFFGYPLMTSMAHTWVYLLGFKYPQFIYSLMYISLGILFYSSLKDYVDRTTSLLFTLLVLISPPVFANAAFAYTNLPYAVYFFLGTIFLYRWITNKKRYLLVIAALMMGLSTWVRSTEPFWIINLMILSFFSLQNKKIVDLFLYALIFFWIQQSWSIYLSHMVSYMGTSAQAGQAFGILKSGFDFQRLGEILAFIWTNTINILSPYILIFLLSIFFPVNQAPGKKYLCVLVTGNMLLLLFGAYIFSYIFVGWSQIGESLQRMVITFVPLLLYTAAMGLNIDWKAVIQKINLSQFWK